MSTQDALNSLTEEMKKREDIPTSKFFFLVTLVFSFYFFLTSTKAVLGFVKPDEELTCRYRQQYPIILCGNFSNGTKSLGEFELCQVPGETVKNLTKAVCIFNATLLEEIGGVSMCDCEVDSKKCSMERLFPKEQDVLSLLSDECLEKSGDSSLYYLLTSLTISVFLVMWGLVFTIHRNQLFELYKTQIQKNDAHQVVKVQRLLLDLLENNNYATKAFLWVFLIIIVVLLCLLWHLPKILPTSLKQFANWNEYGFLSDPCRFCSLETHDPIFISILSVLTANAILIFLGNIWVSRNRKGKPDSLGVLELYDSQINLARLFPSPVLLLHRLGFNPDNVKPKITRWKDIFKSNQTLSNERTLVFGLDHIVTLLPFSGSSEYDRMNDASGWTNFEGNFFLMAMNKALSPEILSASTTQTIGVRIQVSDDEHSETSECRLKVFLRLNLDLVKVLVKKKPRNLFILIPIDKQFLPASFHQGIEKTHINLIAEINLPFTIMGDQLVLSQNDEIFYKKELEALTEILGVGTEVSKLARKTLDQVFDKEIFNSLNKTQEHRAGLLDIFYFLGYHFSQLHHFLEKEKSREDDYVNFLSFLLVALKRWKSNSDTLSEVENMKIDEGEIEDAKNSFFQARDQSADQPKSNPKLDRENSKYDDENENPQEYGNDQENSKYDDENSRHDRENSKYDDENENPQDYAYESY